MRSFITSFSFNAFHSLVSQQGDDSSQREIKDKKKELATINEGRLKATLESLQQLY